jgi:hypothetical protein
VFQHGSLSAGGYSRCFPNTGCRQLFSTALRISVDSDDDFSYLAENTSINSFFARGLRYLSTAAKLIFAMKGQRTCVHRILKQAGGIPRDEFFSGIHQGDQEEP